MPFVPLQDRRASLPDVLVGPVLRLVLADEVSVFLAFKAATKVTLEVFDVGGSGATMGRVMAGTRNTVRLGTMLHVVCVTATGGPLTPGGTYAYDVKLDAPGDEQVEAAGPRRLLTPGVVRATEAAARQLLTYPQGVNPPQLPSFVLPPTDLNALRILHASCRKPHGGGPDALPTGDAIVAAALAGSDHRPHQLFLGGDQIYADDVAVPLLFMLQDAAAALGLPVEQLPVKGGDRTGAQLPPAGRADVLGDKDAGFTSDHRASHLMTFADFALMYVLAWSDALWPAAQDLPGFKEARNDLWQEWNGDRTDPRRQARRPRHEELVKQIAGEREHLARFRAGLPAVRRLLANVPSLMIFDDHEITDDWNLNLAWIKRTQHPVNSDEAPTRLSRAVLRNGMAAFAVFQAWGNTPDRFRAGQADPGTRLLEALAAWDGSAGGPQVNELVLRVGLPTGFTDHVATLPPARILWHYRHRWASHEAIVLDTRTRRGTVRKEDAGGPPVLIYDTADFDAQVNGWPAPAADELTIVVAPAPVFGVPLHEAAARHFKAPWATISPGSDPEHWALGPYAREHFLSALLSRPAAGADNVVRARAVVLSGDVHHGSAVHVRYHATKPFRYPAARIEGVVAQFTSSALKNSDGLTQLIETMGFFRLDSRLDAIVGSRMPLTEVAGWENTGGGERTVGREALVAGDPITFSIEVEGEPALYEFTYAVPFTSPPSVVAPPTYTLTATPDWRYEVRPQVGVAVGRGSPAVLAASAANRDAKVRRLVKAAEEHRRVRIKLGNAQEVVGHNNIGDVSFSWGAGEDKTVVQQLWWQPDDDLEAAPLSRWELRMSTTAP